MSKFSLSRRRVVAGGAAVLMAAPSIARAQQPQPWPTGPITWLNPFPAGGGTDGIFASAALGGVGYPEGMSMGSQVGVQLVGMAAIAAWSGILSWILLKLTDALTGMRVDPEEETEGLDTVLHNETGYNL